MADRVRVQIEGSDYWASGPAFATIVAIVKELPRARFDRAQRLWIIPGEAKQIQADLKSQGVVLQLISGPVVSVVPPSKPPTPKIERPRDVIAVSCNSKEYWVSGGTFQNMVNAVRNVPGRRWDAARKVWTVPEPISETERILQEAGFTIVPAPEQPASTEEPGESTATAEAE